MTGILQGAVVLLLILASSCWCQEALDESQRNFDPSSEVPTDPIPEDTTNQRQLLSRRNFSRQLFRYRNIGQNSLDNRRRYNSEAPNPEGGLRPNSRIGFRRQLDRFRHQKTSSVNHDGFSDHINRSQGSQSNAELGLEDSLSVRGEISPQRDINPIRQVTGSQNSFDFTGSSNSQNNNGQNFESQISSEHSFTLTSGNLAENKFPSVFNAEGHVETVEAMQGDIGSTPFSNEGGPWQDPGSSQTVYEPLENSEEMIGDNEESINSRFRVKQGPNRGRRRFQGQNRRRLMRLRRPWFLRRKMRFESQPDNIALEDRENINSDQDIGSTERIIDPSTIMNPSEKAQRNLISSDGSDTSEKNGNKIAETSLNTLIPETPPSTEGFREQKSLGFENESSNVQEFFSNSFSLNENNSLGLRDNTNNQNGSFRRFPNTNSVRPRIRIPSVLRTNDGLNKGNSQNEADTRFSGNNFRNSDFSIGQSAHIQPNAEAISNDEETFESGSKKIIPVQFTTNRQQFANFGQSINSDLNQSDRSGYSYSKTQELTRLNEFDIQKETKETDLQENAGLINEEEFTFNQQNQRRSQPFRSQFNNNERLHQFQQQIESKRLLQYPQQQSNDRPTTDQLQGRAQQRQQVLEDKRLLQYPQSSGTGESFSSDLSQNNQEDSQLWQSPQSQGRDPSSSSEESDHIQEGSHLLQYPQSLGSSDSVLPSIPENKKINTHLLHDTESQDRGNSVSSNTPESTQEESRLLQNLQSQDKSVSFSPEVSDNNQRNSNLFHSGGTNEQAVQNHKQQYQQRNPIQHNLSPLNSQNLVDRHFKSAQLTDAFGPGRTNAVERKRQQSQQERFVNQSQRFYQAGNGNNENSGYLSNSNINQQIRAQHTGMAFDSITSNEPVEGQTRTLIQGNGNDRTDQEYLTFSEQQELQQQKMSEQRNLWSTESHSDSRFQRLLASEEGISGNGGNIARIPGRINPSDANQLPQGPRTGSNDFRIQATHDGSRDLNNFSHQNFKLNQNNFGNQNAQAIEETTLKIHDNYDSSTKNQNNHLNGDQFASNENQVKQSNTQRIYASGTAENGFENRFAQGNTYLPHQYNRIRQSRLRQNQNVKFQSRIQNNGVNIGLRGDTETKDQLSSRTQHTLAHEGHSEAMNFQHESEAKQKEFQVSGVVDEGQNQNFGFDRNQQFSGRDQTISDQISKQTLNSGEAFESHQSYSQENEHQKYSSPQLSSGNQHSGNQQSRNQQSTFEIDSQQDQILDTEQHTPQKVSRPQSNTERRIFQSQVNNGISEKQQRQGFQTSDSKVSSSGNSQTHQQNLNQDLLQLEVGVDGESRTLFDQRRFGTNSYSSQRKTQLSTSQTYVQEGRNPSQENADQNDLSNAQTKITNAHGHPGFTFQRNFNPLNSVSNKNIDESASRDIHSDHHFSNNQNHRSQTRGELPYSSDTFRQDQHSGRSELSISHQQLDTDDHRQTSVSSTVSRGNRKFLDSFEGLNTEEPKKKVLERIAAVLQGKDYSGIRSGSTKLQRISSSPRLTEIPETGFGCEGRVSGYYADSHELAKCQSFHFCGVDGTKISYLCPTGTVFNQRLLVCDHVFHVQCSISPDFYYVNERAYGANVQQSLPDDSRNFRSSDRRS